MKRFISLLFLGILFFLGTNFCYASNISDSDRAEILSNLNNLVEFVNEGDHKGLSKLISPNNKELQQNIQERIGGGIDYKIDYYPFDDNYEITSDNQVIVKARYEASGISWSVSGGPVNFVFEKVNQKWLLVDTNFYERIGMNYVIGSVLKWLIVLIVVLLLCFAFWLWMLIDCIKSEKFDHKTEWLLIVIFLGIIGAILYYFMVKRKRRVKKQ